MTDRLLEGTRGVLRLYSNDPRVRLVTLDQSQHVSAASNAALSLATGEYVALLDHDDELAPEALAEVVRYLNAHPDADVIYSDEDKLDETGVRCDPYFKPDWSPELFLSYMYTCHLMVVRRQLVEEIGGFRQGFEGAQDYDLLLAPDGEDRSHPSHSARSLPLAQRTRVDGVAGRRSPGRSMPAVARSRSMRDAPGWPAEVLSGPQPGNVPIAPFHSERAARVDRDSDDRAAARPEAAICWPVVCEVSRRQHGADSRSSSRPTTDQMSDSGKERARANCRTRSSTMSPRATFNFSHKVNEAVRQRSR